MRCGQRVRAGVHQRLVGSAHIVRPEDHRGTLAFCDRVEAVIVPGGGNGRDPDRVTVEREVDVDRVAVDGNAEGLTEAQTRVERPGARQVEAEEDHLRTTEHGGPRLLFER